MPREITAEVLTRQQLRSSDLEADGRRHLHALATSHAACERSGTSWN
jgi:hypothetical protein